MVTERPPDPSPAGPEPTPTAANTPTVGGPPRSLEDLARLAPENAGQLQLLAELNGLVTFSPDGETLAAAAQDGITLVDRGTLDEVGFLPCKYEDGCAFEFSGDGQFIAWSPEPGVVIIWDVAAAAPRGELENVPGNCCNEIAFSPDGLLLALQAFPVAGVWDAPSGEERFRLEPVGQVFFSPDGQTLATTSQEGIRIHFWDVTNGALVRTLEGFETAAPIYLVNFSPDWSRVLWIARANALLMEVESGQAVAELVISDGLFSPGGRILAGTEQGWGEFPCTGQVCLFDTVSGELLSTLAMDDFVQVMTFSPAGRLLAAAGHTGITVWDVARGEPLATRSLQATTLLSISPDGQLLAASYPERPAQLWGVPPNP